MATGCDNGSRQGEMWSGCPALRFSVTTFTSFYSPPFSVLAEGSLAPLLGSRTSSKTDVPHLWSSQTVRFSPSPILGKPIGCLYFVCFHLFNGTIAFYVCYSSGLFLSGLPAPSQNVTSWRGGTQAVILTEALRDWNTVSGQLPADFIIS